MSDQTRVNHELFRRLDHAVSGIESNGRLIAESGRRLHAVEQQQHAQGMQLVRLEGKLDVQNGRVERLEKVAAVTDGRLWRIALASGGGAAAISAAVVAILRILGRGG